MYTKRWFVHLQNDQFKNHSLHVGWRNRGTTGGDSDGGELIHMVYLSNFGVDVEFDRVFYYECNDWMMELLAGFYQLLWVFTLQ